MMSAFLFDLGGTLVESGYQHVPAWRGGMHTAGIEVAVWRDQSAVRMGGGAHVEWVASGKRPNRRPAAQRPNHPLRRSRRQRLGYARRATGLGAGSWPAFWGVRARRARAGGCVPGVR